VASPKGEGTRIRIEERKRNAFKKIIIKKQIIPNFHQTKFSTCKISATLYFTKEKQLTFDPKGDQS
jgi:hypothetical protein